MFSHQHVDLNDAKLSVAGNRLLSKDHDNGRVWGGFAVMINESILHPLLEVPSNIILVSDVTPADSPIVFC